MNEHDSGKISNLCGELTQRLVLCFHSQIWTQNSRLLSYCSFLYHLPLLIPLRQDHCSMFLILPLPCLLLHSYVHLVSQNSKLWSLNWGYLAISAHSFLHDYYKLITPYVLLYLNFSQTVFSSPLADGSLCSFFLLECCTL